MNKQRTKSHTFTFNYKAPRAINLGDVFYTVERRQYKYFLKKHHDVPGLNAECRAAIELFLVIRYEISEIQVAKRSNRHKVLYTFSHYVDIRNGETVDKKTFHGKCAADRDFCLCSDIFIKKYNQPPEDGLYDDYEHALYEATKKNKLIQEHLSEFNAKYGTDFEVDFNALKHDPK